MFALRSLQRTLPLAIAAAASSQIYSSSHASAEQIPINSSHLLNIQSSAKPNLSALDNSVYARPAMNHARTQKNIYLGRPHTLIESANGNIWKLTNTLSEADIESIKRQYGEAPTANKYKTQPGSRGYVRFAWNNKHGYCAVKKFLSDSFEEGKKELNVLMEVSRLMPEETRPLLDYAISKNSKGQPQVYLFIRWIPGTDGVGFANALYENQESDQQIAHIIVQVAQQLFADVAIMHEQGMAHRDIKLENLMVHKDKVGNPQIELIDFGDTLTNFSDTERRVKLCGTSGYIPPEVLIDKNIPDPKIQDVWASLMSLVILLTTRISPNLSNDFHQNLADQEEQLIHHKKNINVIGTVLKHLEVITAIFEERMGAEFKNSEMQWCLRQLQQGFKEYAHMPINRLAQRFNKAPPIIDRINPNTLHSLFSRHDKIYA